MPILPVGTANMQPGPGGRRRQQPGMNYATGTPPAGTSGGGQTQTPAQTGIPQLNIGFGGPSWANANPAGMPMYRNPQAYMTGPTPQLLPARFQRGYGGVNPMAGQLLGQAGNVQVPNGMAMQNFAGRLGGMQGGDSLQYAPFPD